ncbi:NAD-binding protein [candidate division KSB1 bacterium]|nr:NAD-binding protein [candidate division KSB1 bacterium]
MGSQRLALKNSARFLVNKIYRYPVLITFVISIAVMAGCAFIIAIEEDISLFDALLRVLAFFLGELGTIEGDSLVRIATAVGLISGVVFIAIIGAKIVTLFVNLSTKGGRIMKKVSYKDHIIICGWNNQGKNIIKQLLSPDIKQKRPIVILANLDKRPIDEDRVDFISGDPTKKADLEKAGIMTANTAIILTNMSSGLQKDINPDAQALLMTLAVETARPEVYTCVQLVNSEYREHLEHVNVDEYISFDHLGSNLMVASALNHGLSRILNGLLTFDVGSEIYKVETPDAFVNKEFRKVAKELIDKKMTLLAVETAESNLDSVWKEELAAVRMLKDGKAWIVNPQKDYTLHKGDGLYIIAEKEPTKNEMPRS